MTRVRCLALDCCGECSEVVLSVDGPSLYHRAKKRERQLQRQNVRLDTFASVAAHDLRTPLNVVGERLELAREERDSGHLDAASNAVDRSLTLIDELLTPAREGTRVDEATPVDLTRTTDECWRNVETADAPLVVESEREIQADQSRLQQLLEN